MAEPPPLDESVLGDEDVSFMDGRSSGGPATESAVLSKLEHQTQEIKSLKAALLEQKELYRAVLSELNMEKEKNKALGESLKELKGATSVALPSVDQTAPEDHTDTHPVPAVVATAETARLNEKIRAYELELRSLRDEIKAWDEAAALNESKIQQLQQELASTVDGKENALKVMQEATRQVKQLEEELARQKGSPRTEKTVQSHSKRPCTYSVGQVADLVAEAEALRMNLDVARRNLKETERLREIDAKTIEQMRNECDKLTALVAAKMAEQEKTKPPAFVGTEGAERLPSVHQMHVPAQQHSTPPCNSITKGDANEDKNAAVAASCVSDEGRGATLEEGRVTLSDERQAMTEEQKSIPSHGGAQVVPECCVTEVFETEQQLMEDRDDNVGPVVQHESISILIS